MILVLLYRYLRTAARWRWLLWKHGGVCEMCHRPMSTVWKRHGGKPYVLCSFHNEQFKADIGMRMAQ